MTHRPEFRMRRALAVLALVAGLVGPAGAAELRVLTAGAFKASLLAAAPAVERATGHTLKVENDTAGGLLRRIGAGERFDLVVLPPSGLAELERSGLVAAGSGRPLARTGIGLAVKEGTPAPDIATVEAFRAALLAAPSVAMIDPKAGGSSGVYLAGLFERLGIADAVARKAVLVPGGYVAERVASGEAALALHQISEILPVAGARLVGPLPEPIQNHTVYAAAVGAAASDPGAAAAVLRILAGPETAALLKARGMEPAGAE